MSRIFLVNLSIRKKENVFYNNTEAREITSTKANDYLRQDFRFVDIRI